MNRGNGCLGKKWERTMQTLSSKTWAFAQNTREEVRMLGDVAGCVSAETGTHQTTYVYILTKKKVI